MNDTSKRKQIITIITVFVAIIVLLVVIKLMMTSFVSIKTDDDAAIVIQKRTGSGDSSELTEVASGVGSLFYVGDSGNYVITVSRFSTQQSQSKNFGPFLTQLSYSFADIPDNHTPEPIANVDARDIRVLDNQSITYTDTSNGKTYKLSGTAAPLMIDETDANDISWTEDGIKGITQPFDGENISTVDRSSGAISLTPVTSIEGGLSYDAITAISAKGVIYISDKNTVYRSTDFGKNFTKLYTTRAVAVNIYPLGEDRLLILDESQHQKEGVEDPVTEMIVVTSDGSVVAKKDGVHNRNSFPSPDGRYFVMDDFKKGVLLYDTAHLATLQELPIQGSVTVDWIDDNTLLYANTRELSVLSLGENGISRTVAIMPTGHIITHLQYLKESGEVYITSSIANSMLYLNKKTSDESYLDTSLDYNMSYLSKINYKKPVDTSHYAPTLFSSFPVLYGDCILTYNTLGSFTVLSEATETYMTDGDCEQLGRDYIKTLNLPFDSINFTAKHSTAE